nr:hypothetical protein [Rhodobacter calidifons]
MTHQPEPFALAGFELHRVIAEAPGNPFLRAASALLEFGIAHAVQSRLTPDLSAPPEGLAAATACTVSAACSSWPRRAGA